MPRYFWIWERETLPPKALQRLGFIYVGHKWRIEKAQYTLKPYLPWWIESQSVFHSPDDRFGFTILVNGGKISRLVHMWSIQKEFHPSIHVTTMHHWTVEIQQECGREKFFFCKSSVLEDVLLWISHVRGYLAHRPHQLSVDSHSFQFPHNLFYFTCPSTQILFS